MRKLLAIVAVLIGALLFMASRQPDVFTVERSVLIAAPADSIYPYVSDLTRWSSWSPWEKLDPLMLRVYNGAPGATGSSYYWNGNRNVGSGTVTVRELLPPSKVTLQLDMLEPMGASNVVEFTLTPSENATTRVTWTMRGRTPFIGKIAGVFMNMDTMVGADFESGLATLQRRFQR